MGDKQQLLQFFTIVLPLIVLVLVGLLKRWGLTSQAAPAATAIISLIAGAVVWQLYPDQGFIIAVNTIYGGFAAGTVYGLKKYHAPGAT